ncbi:MAG: DUF881 domain-containing protein [Clostridia bacterium]|nr:DUF881 domain-containing protein [Clostridia bacterium]
MKKLGTPIIFGILCLILSLAITVQLRVTNTSESTSSKTRSIDKLKDQILALNDENNKLTAKLQNTSNDLQKVRDEAAENDSSSIEKSDLIKKYIAVIGYTDVSGEGVSIKYTPTKNQYKADIAKDLRDIINELKNAGIEAISINGQRMINTSAIEMVKNKIEINNIEITAPYTINVIGNSEIITSGLVRPGGLVENIRNTGVKIDIEMKDNVKINKFSEYTSK